MLMGQQNGVQVGGGHAAPGQQRSQSPHRQTRIDQDIRGAGLHESGIAAAAAGKRLDANISIQVTSLIKHNYRPVSRAASGKQAVYKGHRVEILQIFGFFTDSDQLDRQFQFVGDGNHNATACGPIQLRQRDSR